MSIDYVFCWESAIPAELAEEELVRFAYNDPSTRTIWGKQVGIFVRAIEEDDDDPIFHRFGFVPTVRALLQFFTHSNAIECANACVFLPMRFLNTLTGNGFVTHSMGPTLWLRKDQRWRLNADEPFWSTETLALVPVEYSLERFSVE